MALGKMALEHLESELLLSKGGGIYYDNARVEASENEATLFIGLGGTGADMLIRIKNEVKRRMVLPQRSDGKITSDTPNNIGFLAIDTDMTSMKKTWGTATFDQFGSEFCSISVDDKQAIVVKWKKLAESNADEATWYDRIDAVGALPGAGGIRQMGRLLLFENIRNTRERMSSKVRELIAGGINKVTVMIVAGIAGGTGSGTFIDIAYIARSVLEDLAIPGRNEFGYIVMPDVNLLNGGQEDSLKRNGFAALKELDYWMSPGEGEQNDQFVQNYGSSMVRSVASKVFDFCHLLSAQDMDGLPLTYNKVIGSMAENIFAYIAGEDNATNDDQGNTAMKSMYDNIDTYITSLDTSAPIPACYRYLAVGSHKLEIPFEEISTLLAIRLFERLKPTFDLRPNEETFKADMTRMQLVPNQVINDSLLRDIYPSPLDGNPNYQHGQIWGGENTGPKNNRPYFDAYQWLARELQPKTKANGANWANAQNGVFRNFINDNMKKVDRGPLYLAAMIKSDNKWSMIPTLTSMAEQCDGVAASCASRVNEIEARLAAAYNAGHGKIMNKQKYVVDYLSALYDWMSNDMALFVYPLRAEAIRDLRDRLQVYYDKVFSKLADVLEALPEIFRQNYDYIALEQRRAEQEGKLDETKLIWPLKYEQENKQDFMKMLETGIVGFLDDMTNNMERWTGCDLDTLEATSTGSDVPGFISRFISEQFGSLLNINMESIMASKEGADNLDPYLRRILLNIKDKSVPMFSMNQTYRNTSTADFGLISVPQDCLQIAEAAKNYIAVAGSRVTRKTSKEKTRIYFVKVVSGIPLYAYSKIEDMERFYEEAKGRQTSKGIHLNGEWMDKMPTPLPQTAWTPTVYENANVKKYNDTVREAFDFCLALENGPIRIDPDNPKKIMLYIADPTKADVASLDLGDHSSLEEQLAALREIQAELWGGHHIVLSGMGTLGGEDYTKNVRESVLRLPAVAEEIKCQREIASSFAKRAKELEDPRYFAFGLITGLIDKNGFKIVFKRSLDSASSDMLYDITTEKPFGEYEAYKEFKAKLDDQRRSDINLVRSEMLDRISVAGEERTRTQERIEGIIKTYSAELPEVKSRLERAAADRRKPLQETYNFYSSVLKIAEGFLNRFLS